MLTAIQSLSRLVISPAYRRCLVDLPSVCRHMVRRSLSRFPREERDNALRYARDGFSVPPTFKGTQVTQDCYKPGKQGERIFAKCTCKVCQGNWNSTGWADENIVASPLPLAEGKVDTWVHPTHEYTVSLADTIVHPLIGRMRTKHGTCQYGESLPVYHGILRYKTAPGVAPKEHFTETPEDKCERCAAERKAKKEGCACDIKIAHTCYADNARKSLNSKGEYRPTGAATCDALFTSGEKEEDGFSRTIALRYLQKRMVFSPKSNAKGKEDAPVSLKRGRTSSAKHATSFYNASDIEDTIQEAYTLYHAASLILKGSWTESETTVINSLSKEERNTVERLARAQDGNRLHDTTSACQQARQLMMRKRYNERKRVAEFGPDGKRTTYGMLAMVRAHRQETMERSRANRFYDAELDSLLAAVQVHGYESQKLLAEVLDISAGELCKRLARLRDRCERQERELSADRTRFAHGYAMHGA